MIELGYFALGFAAGVVFTFVGLLSVGRWLKSVTQEEPPPEVVQKSPVKKHETMWN